MKDIPVIDIFNMIYNLYHDKGLTSTAAKFLVELKLYEEWKEFLKIKEKEIN